MPSWIAFVLAIGIPAVVLALMPWRKPHPNHVLALQMLDAISNVGTQQETRLEHEPIPSRHEVNRLKHVR